MNRKKNVEQIKNRNRSSSQKAKTDLASKEKFNTGSHTPSSLRNVGPGYDDTGMSYEKSKEIDADDAQNKKR